LLTVGVGTIGSYGLARFNFRGRDTIAISILFTYLFPPILLLIPLYVLMYDLRLVNTLASLVICYQSFTIPFFIWFMRSYFTTLPVDVEEQGLVDGCSIGQVFLRITIPIASPGMAAGALLSFANSYMEYLFAFVMMNSRGLFTLPVGLSLYAQTAVVGGGYVSWGDVMGASLLASIPVVILFFALQKYLVTGLTAGAIKG